MWCNNRLRLLGVTSRKTRLTPSNALFSVGSLTRSGACDVADFGASLAKYCIRLVRGLSSRDQRRRRNGDRSRHAINPFVNGFMGTLRSQSRIRVRARRRDRSRELRSRRATHRDQGLRTSSISPSPDRSRRFVRWIRSDRSFQAWRRLERHRDEQPHLHERDRAPVRGRWAQQAKSRSSSYGQSRTNQSARSTLRAPSCHVGLRFSRPTRNPTNCLQRTARHSP
jgi:hypothetical protein